MSLVKLPHIQSFRNRHGKLVNYFRKRGCKTVRLRGVPGSPEFIRAYERALGNPEPIEIGARRAKARSVVAVTSMMQMYNRIAAKFASFLNSGSEPAGYLYRHYHPSGDLLYIGITTQSVSKRTKAHLFKASWKDFICLIVVEPFATREELLEAERDAIRAEFPKYNQVTNGYRHPIQEIRQQASEQRRHNVLARRAAEAALSPADDTESLADTMKPAE
jgi:hypothetical protein